jgi:tripartite-type tricarboxylate transporter receptor subunit TctC
MITYTQKLCGALLLALVAATQTLAAFPEKPVRIIVPFAPGGGNDIIARALSDGMAKQLGQQVIVENKPGAGTVIGADFVAKSKPDGYNVLIASFAQAVNPSLLPKLPYDPEKAFASVALIGIAPNVLVVPPDRPYRSVPELIAAAKAAPGKINYGSYGSGTSAHLAAELFKLLAKVDIKHIPYKGSAPALTDMLGARLDVMFTTFPSVALHIRNNRLRALAVTSAKRSPAFPELPTVAEAGVPGYAAQTFYGILAPAGTPEEAIAKLHDAIKVAADGENFRKRSAEDGLVVNVGGPAVFAKFLQEEEARWRRVIKEANIKPE